MAYPHGIDAMPTFTDGVSPTDPTPSAVLTAAEMTTIASAITRIQEALGLDPAAGRTSVSQRILEIEQSLQDKVNIGETVTITQVAEQIAAPRIINGGTP